VTTDPAPVEAGAVLCSFVNQLEIKTMQRYNARGFQVQAARRFYLLNPEAIYSERARRVRAENARRHAAVFA
jgi:hypothetical protein